MIIDCHSHHISAPYNTNYFTWAEETGHRDYGPPYLWNNPVFEDISKRIDIMKENHITYSVITYSSNIVQIVDSVASNGLSPKEVVSDLNNKAHETVLNHVESIGATALIDLRLGEEALAEMERTCDWALGFSVLTAYHMGRKLAFLDDPAFLSFWKKAERLGKPVFIHFSSLYKIHDKELLMPGYMNDSMLCAGMGQLMEDSLCISRLVLSGLFDCCPGLKVVLGQLGGMYPFMLERFEMLYHMHKNGADKKRLNVTEPSDLDHFLRNYKNYTDNIYVDTHSMSVSGIRCAAEILGEDKILFGSDLPITPKWWGIERGIEEIQKSVLKDSVKDKILYANARKLLKLQ